MGALVVVFVLALSAPSLCARLFAQSSSPGNLHLAWSTYLGGSGEDSNSGVVTDENGNIFVTGSTNSMDFPPFTTTHTLRAHRDAYISKFDTSGTLLWTVFIGGNGDNYPLGLGTDSSGSLLVTGSTWSSDFATSGAYDTTYNGGNAAWGDAFLAKLKPDGTTLWATYLGGSGEDYGWSVVTDESRNIYVNGFTTSPDFPTTGPFKRTYAGVGDGFVTKFSPNGRLIWSNLLGGRSLDIPYGIRIGDSGNLYVTGRTSSDDFPTTQGYSMTYGGGGTDSFISKFTADGTMLWSTYFGGNGDDSLSDVVWDRSTSIYVVGGTSSTNLPAEFGWDSTHNGGFDAFLAQFRTDGSFVKATYYGGTGDDAGRKISVASSGNLVVAGVAGASDFPTTGGGNMHYGGGISDVFVSEFRPTLIPCYSGFLGGNARDESKDFILDEAGNMIIEGMTQAADFPTTRGWDTSFNGGAWDGFITKFSREPVSTQPLLVASPTRFELSVREGAQAASATLEVWNGGQGTLLYSVEASPSALLGVSPPAGQSSGARQQHSVFFNTVGLSAGLYGGSLTITGNAVNSPRAVPVVITVSPVVPPVEHSVEWSTYLGGNGTDGVTPVLTDSDGNIFIAGCTDSTDFPAPGAPPTDRTSMDAFVSKFSPDGTLLWTFFIGGSGRDVAMGLARDPRGNLLITGSTWSADFPTSAAYDPSYNGGDSLWGDAYVCKLSPDGTLLWSTYLGGSGEEYGWGIKTDQDGNVYVTGLTTSADFPTSGAHRATLGGSEDAFLAKFSPDGRLRWSTYHGGSGADRANGGLALDDEANIYLTGPTGSADFPTSGGWNTTFNGGSADGYLSKFSRDGALIWSTYFGGTGDDAGSDVVLDPAGWIYVLGGTTSSDFPTPGGWDTTPNGGFDIIVAKFNPDGALIQSTYLGGSGTDGSWGGIDLDSGGNVYVTGFTTSTDFPTIGPGSIGHNAGDYDVFLSAFDPTGTLIYSTYLGGSGRDEGRDLATDRFGNVIVAGTPQSTDFPTTGGWDKTYNGGSWDVSLTKFARSVITTQPLIAVSPSRLDLVRVEGTLSASATLQVWNSGAGTLSYDLNSSPSGLLSVSPPSGQSSGERNPHVVTFQTAPLTRGTYSAVVMITGNAANSSHTVPVMLVITPPPPPFSTPVPVAELNSLRINHAPWISEDGREIYFASDRDDPYVANYHIYHSTRSNVALPFDPPVLVPEINQGPKAANPFVLDDGLTMYFDGSYLGGASEWKIWQITRPSVGDAWDSTTQREAPGVNTPGGPVEDNAAADVTPDGLALYFHSDRSHTGWDLFKSVRASTGEDFGVPVAVTEFNTSAHERNPFMTRDGLMFFFSSDRPGGRGLLDLWVATRGSTGQPFGIPTNLWSLNSVHEDLRPSFHESTKALYFCSSRPGTFGSIQIYRSYLTSGPVISVSPVKFDFSFNAGTQPATSTLEVWNSGFETLTYDLQTSPSGLVDVLPAQGDSSGAHNLHTLVFHTASLVPGTHRVVITATGNAINSPIMIPITITITTIPPPNIFTLPDHLDATVAMGWQRAVRNLEVHNGGSAPLTYTMTTSPTTWISAQPAGGTVAPGDFTAHQIVFNTTALSSGTYPAIVQIESVSPSFSMSVPVSLTVQPRPYTILFPNGGESLQLGTTAQIRWTVNQSNGSPLKIQVMRGAPNDWTGSVGVATYMPISPTATPFDWYIDPGLFAPGTNYWINLAAMIGHPDLWADWSDGNFTLVAPPPMPNLTLGNCDFGPAAPAQLRPGDPLALSAMIRNVEAGTAGRFWTEMWGSRTGGLTLDRFLADSLFLPDGLAGSASHSWATTTPLYSIPDGSYSVVYAVDRPGQVSESNERDNRTAVRGKRLLVIRPQTQADLTVEGFSLSPNPARSGQPVSFTGRVTNRGTERSGPFWIEFWGSWEWPFPAMNFFLCDSIPVLNLNPGQSLDLASHSPRTLYRVPTGVFMVGCVVDREDSVNETDETNNFQFVDGQVFNSASRIERNPAALAGAADIVIADADCSPVAPAQLAPGCRIAFTVNLANQGGLPTGPFWLEYWGSRDGGLTLTDFLMQSDPVTNLAPGAQVELKSTKPLSGIPDGPYSIMVFADRPGVVPESNETNNRFVLRGKRVLVIRPATGANLTLEGFNVQSAGWPNLALSGQVRNSGGADSGPFWVEFWAAGGNPDYPTLERFACDSIRVDNLAAGDSLNLAAYPRSLYTSLRPGTYAIVGFVDRLDQVIETDETDNYGIVRNFVVPPH